MAYIKEEIKHEYLQEVELQILEREKFEYADPWRIATLQIDAKLSPKEMRELGKWLIQQGKRIGREYKSNGESKVKAHTKQE